MENIAMLILLPIYLKPIYCLKIINLSSQVPAYSFYCSQSSISAFFMALTDPKCLIKSGALGPTLYFIQTEPCIFCPQLFVILQCKPVGFVLIDVTNLKSVMSWKAPVPSFQVLLFCGFHFHHTEYGILNSNSFNVPLTAFTCPNPPSTSIRSGSLPNRHLLSSTFILNSFCARLNLLKITSCML